MVHYIFEIDYDDFYAKIARNDRDTNRIDFGDVRFTNEHAPFLGVALWQQGNSNSRIREIYVCPTDLVVEAGGDDNDSCCALLLQFVRRSQALRRFKLDGGKPRPPGSDSVLWVPQDNESAVKVTIAGRFVLAIAQSPAIEELELNHLIVSYQEVDALVSTAT